MPQTASLNADWAVEVVSLNPELRIVPPGLPDGTFGRPFSFQFSAWGGTPPYSWSITGFPSGMTISSDGILAGTPMSPGDYEVTITVTDSSP